MLTQTLLFIAAYFSISVATGLLFGAVAANQDEDEE